MKRDRGVVLYLMWNVEGNDLENDFSKTKTIVLAADINIKSPSNMCPPCYLTTRIQFTTFHPFISKSNISRKLRVGYRRSPFQVDMRGRGESGSHGTGKLLVDSGSPWRNAERYEIVDNVTSGNYHRHPFWGGGADMGMDQNLIHGVRRPKSYG